MFEQIQRGDPDGFLARMLIVTPKLVSFKYDDYSTTDGGMEIEDILSAIKDFHSSMTVEYSFSDNALPHFRDYHDRLVAQASTKNILEDADQRAVILKSPVSIKIKCNNPCESHPNKSGLSF